MTIEVLPARSAPTSETGRAQHSLESTADSDGTLTIAPGATRGPASATGTTMASHEDGRTERLPSGHLTFVFTDIEASTRLYKVLGDQIAGDVFDIHNVHLRAAWDMFGGYEVHTEGDSFFVVFEDPNAAVAACVEVQERLAAVDWPKDGDVRVRIGMHCGLAAPRNDDYMALAVHQAARVMSAANGNQVLVTDAILQRLDPLQGATVARAGRYRLRDFDEAPTLYRIDSTSIACNDHPPRATPANHHNLVSRLTSFVGRDEDIAAVSALLTSSAAVTVAGLGGMGKTRLAIETGMRVAPLWESGVWMVELAEVVDPELIAEEVASSIGVNASSVGDRWDDVIEFVGDSAMLLILDNVEHLIADVAELVPRLLRRCPNAAVLSTSREPLNCQGESVYRLNPLSLGARDQDHRLIPSVELFLDRASAVVADFLCEPNDLDEILEICRDLDGLPLAIEIAAAQVSVLQLSEIRSGLSNRFRLLRSRDRALPDRHRTMEGLLGWSYQLLTESEQRAFRRLAVFGGSFHIDAAEAALAGDGINADDIPELIWALVDKSLVTADLSDSSTRYRLLESVRSYAMRLLIDNDDPQAVALGLGQWLLTRIAPWNVNDRVWLGQVSIELPNVRNVVDLIADADPEMAQQLMCSVGRYHDTIQSYKIGIDELARAAATLPLRSPSRVALLAETAVLHLRMAQTDAAAELLDEATRLEKDVGPPAWNDVAVERVRGELAIRANDYAAAIEVARNALARDISTQGQARMWSALGIAQASNGNLEDGLAALEAALEIYAELGDAPHLALAHANVAEAAWRSGLHARAALHQRFCLQDSLAIGQQLATATSLVMAGYLAECRRDWAGSVTLHARAQAMLEEGGHQPYDDTTHAVEQMQARAAAAIGIDLVAEAIAAGQRMTPLKAAELAFATFDAEISTNCTSP